MNWRFGLPLCIIGIVVALLILGKKNASDLSSHPTPVRQKETNRQIREQESDAKQLRYQKSLILSDWKELQKWLSSPPSPSAEEIREHLLQLRIKWSQLDPFVLAGSLAGFLSSGENRELPLDFEVGPHGLLAGWPDLRTFLVDALAVADPDESAQIARKVMEETDSPAEYAVAIRSLIRGSSADASTTELNSYLNTLLSKPRWRDTTAVAESLDLARHIGDPAAASTLLNWDGNPDLKEMALHEFAADHPATMIAQLKEEDVSEEKDVSSLMARADPADPEQASAVDAYLRDPSVPPQHKSRFLSLFPLRSLTTGYRLYSGTPAPYDEASVRRSDQAASQQVESWIDDPSLTDIRPDLLKLRKQLADWMKVEDE